MTHEVKAYFAIGEGSERLPISGYFEEDEWAALLEYLRYVRELQSIQLVREGGPGRLTLSYTAESGLSYSVDLPPDEQIIALLHRLRPFVLNDEQANFYRICNHLARRFDNGSLRNLLDSLRDIYSGRRMQALVRIQSNEVLLNSEDTLMKWLNAHEYHKNRDKQAELAALHHILPLETSRAIFVMMLYDKARAIIVVANLINVLVGGQDSFRCPLD